MSSIPRPDLSVRPLQMTCQYTINAKPEEVYAAWAERFDTWFAQLGSLAMVSEPGRPYFFYNRSEQQDRARRDCQPGHPPPSPRLDRRLQVRALPGSAVQVLRLAALSLYPPVASSLRTARPAGLFAVFGQARSGACARCDTRTFAHADIMVTTMPLSRSNCRMR